MESHAQAASIKPSNSHRLYKADRRHRIHIDERRPALRRGCMCYESVTVSHTAADVHIPIESEGKCVTPRPACLYSSLHALQGRQSKAK